MKQAGSSAVRLLVLLALLVVACAVSYVKGPATRKFADEKLPFVKGILGRFVTAPEEGSPDAPPADGTPAAAAVPAPAAMTFEKLAADPTSWPRTVRLKKAVEIPAVVGGKEVGKVMVKAGTEVNLARIKDGNVGIEYQGGGAWVKPEETDVMERAQPPPAPKPAPATPETK